MKTLMKIGSITLIIILILASFSNADVKTTLNVIQQSSETKELENDQGNISKSIVDSNPDAGEVTVELKLSNTKKESSVEKSTEIFLVVDNSPSMDFVTSTGKTRKELVLNSANRLITSIFNNASNVEVGLIDFHGEKDGLVYEPAWIYNATVRQSLTNDKEKVLSAIQKQLERKTESGTNIDAGLQTAQKNFSKKDNNKIIILLTDGIPNADVKGTENEDGNDVTDKGNIEIGNNTKATLLNLKSAGIYTITLLTGMSELDGNTDKSGTIYEDKNTLEEKLKAAENIFGTTSNPTADKYYLVNNLDINKIITEDILKDVTAIVHNSINNTKIVDYFPEDIIDNFEFSYVGNPSVGSASDKIDKDTKTVTWDIGTLKGNEIATLRYKLKLKDMKNSELLNKTIATNEKVVLTYKDTEAKDYTVELTSSPKIQLSEFKQELTATVSYNPTTNTTGNVVATIKTNKKVNKVDGWTLSEDGMTLTKSYLSNVTENVHLVDIDGMTKDVQIKISNIISSTNKDEVGKDTTLNNNGGGKDLTTAKGVLPNTGISTTIIMCIIIITVIALVMYKKYNKYKDIK